MSKSLIMLSVFLYVPTSGAAVPRRSVLQLLAGVLAGPAVPKAPVVAPSIPAPIPAPVAAAESLAAAHRSFRAAQIADLYDSLKMERVDTYVPPVQGLMFAYEDFPNHYPEHRAEVERIRAEYLRAVENDDAMFRTDLGSAFFASEAYARDRNVAEEWTADRIARVMGLEDALARQFGATLPEVQRAIGWILHPHQMIDYAFDAGSLAERPLYSEDFRRAYLVGFAPIAPVTAFKLMVHRPPKYWLKGHVLDNLKLKHNPYHNHFEFTFHRPPYAPAQDLDTMGRKIAGEIDRLRRARVRFESLSESQLKVRLGEITGETLDALTKVLETLPQRVEATQLGIATSRTVRPEEWAAYEKTFANERARAGVTAPLISAAEWFRLVNLAAVAHGQLAPIFEDAPEASGPAAPEAVPVAVPAEDCQAALSAPVEVPLTVDLQENELAR